MSDIDVLKEQWEARDVAGAGWQIFSTLPAGFKFDATYQAAAGTTKFMTWVFTRPAMIRIASERWVQFETEQWKEAQAVRARLIAAAPELLAACEAALNPELNCNDVEKMIVAAIQKARTNA